MKKLIIIAMAVLCVASCGQRRAAKTQGSEQKDSVKDSIEVVQGDCCSGQKHGECDEMVRDEQCTHATEKAPASVDCKKETTSECAKEASGKEGVTVVQLGKKPGPKPIKPVKPLDRQ